MNEKNKKQGRWHEFLGQMERVGSMYVCRDANDNPVAVVMSWKVYSEINEIKDTLWLIRNTQGLPVAAVVSWEAYCQMDDGT